MNAYVSKAILFLREFMDQEDVEVSESSHVIADLGLNSLQLVEIVNDAEDEFDITISDDELDRILTVGDIARLLEQKGVSLD